MKISSIEIHHYRLPLDPPFNASWDPRPRTSHTSTIVRVRAGDYEGVGSGDAMLGFAGHEYLFLGCDPFDIERHVRLLDSLQFNYGRMWPLEVALWDLMGKITGQPLWKLLGGRSQSVRVYASTGERMPDPQRAETAKNLRAAGFPALKLRFHAADPRDDIAMAQAVRDAIGPEMHILVDANQAWRMPWDASPSWDFKTALWVADALAELGGYWLEEPLDRHDYTGLAALRQRARLRIAGGEATASSPSSANIYGTDRSTSISRTWCGAPASCAPGRSPAKCRLPARSIPRTLGATAWCCWPTCTSRRRSLPRHSSSSPSTRLPGPPSGATSS